MIELLQELERGELKGLLNDEAGWNSLDINYHPPRVERLWRSWRDEYRIYLHVIHPCEKDEALFHPHPWASTIHVLKNAYEMGLGVGSEDTAPPEACRLIITGGAQSYYEMLHINSWHYVRPISFPSWTIMLTGKPWGRPAPKSGKPLLELTPMRKCELLTEFRKLLSPNDPK